ncbi:S41 family peptidase [Emticicia sp. BO119]|uniref:S41 family peptidase n=1 Tax=Emticicia sp. BO119 TaxID=2757768 RepID=UPI0015F0A407|nr:S41 family peptidase [Emticicia sp. BO119]MBA4848785.1 S41 family peptidase [Emticicia sp. BO119]
MKRIRQFSIVILIVLTIPFVAFKYDDRYFEIAKNLDIFATMFKELNAYYVDEINPNKAMRQSIESMLKQLDPYTNFYPEDDIEDYMTMATGKYNGIGATVSHQNNKHLVVMIYEGSPADKAGMKIGDEILKIDGVDVVARKGIDMSRLLKGQTGTTVKMQIKRYGQNSPMELTVGRDIVKTLNVPHSGMINDEVGYIQLNDFTATAAKEVKSAFSELKASGMKKLIFDLRGNPGGLLNMSVEICNVFLPKDQLIVETRGKVADWNKKFTSLENPMDTEIPIVVLVNSMSASAAEIVSGTLQDYDRAVIIGQRSFGKGLVQTTRDLTYNTKMKITTAKYYIPSGRCIQALDYSHRNADGSVGKVPDSLKTAFKTKNGRTVYDGGGIDPDIKTEVPVMASVTANLLAKNVIFDYATKYYFEHANEKPQEKFSLTDAAYQDFANWLKTRNFTYSTSMEKSLDNLEASAKKENSFDAVQENLKSLRDKINQSKQQDLVKNKADIKEQLEAEILSRYYYQKAMKFVSFEHDKEVQEALKLFKDMPKYQSILKGGK